MELEKALREAANGFSVLYIRKNAIPLCVKINDGWLFIRSHKLSGLKSVAVHKVIIDGKAPDRVHQLAMARVI